MKNPHTPSRSQFTKTLLVRPQDLNHAGTLFGGTIMACLDELAFIAATLTYPHCTFVTKVFHEFNFLAGASEGDIITIAAQVLKTGHTSGLWRCAGKTPKRDKSFFVPIRSW